MSILTDTNPREISTGYSQRILKRLTKFAESMDYDPQWEVQRAIQNLATEIAQLKDRLGSLEQDRTIDSSQNSTDQ